MQSMLEKDGALTNPDEKSCQVGGGPIREGVVQGTIYVCQPQYSGGIPGSHRQFWIGAGSQNMNRTHYSDGGSLLAHVFNRFWTHALNLKAAGENITHFAMLHDDIEPQTGWLDILMEEIRTTGADLVAAVVPIKDWIGLTSTAIDLDGFRVRRRITMKEVFSLPKTFDVKDCGYDKGLLANTGCWVCDFTKPWVGQVYEEDEVDESATNLETYLQYLTAERTDPQEALFDKDLRAVVNAYREFRKQQLGTAKVFFTIRDRIRKDTHPATGKTEWISEVAPEDWNFSRMVEACGGRIMVTRKVSLKHWGHFPFTNQEPWGTQETDQVMNRVHGGVPICKPGYEYDKQTVKARGWLTEEEGDALAHVATDKNVLEIGTYCGRSTIWMARVAQLVTTVDTFDGAGTPNPGDTLQEALKNFAEYNVIGNVKILQGKSEDVLTSQCNDLGDYDFIFIDGAHDYESVKKDFELSSRLMKSGGMIGFHDYNALELGVDAVVNELLLSREWVKVCQVGKIIFIRKKDVERSVVNGRVTEQK